MNAIRYGVLAAAALLLTGCHTDMWIQPKVKAQEASTFFPDKMSSRLPVPGTVAVGQLNEDDALHTGRVNGKLVTQLPIPLDKELLERGHERFTVFCSPCHGQLGDGNGMIAQRGFNLRKKPASYHTERLHNMPIGHFFDVMTHGSGTMFSYASRVPVEDRWAIAAYIRALQASQNAGGGEVSALNGGQDAR